MIKFLFKTVCCTAGQVHSEKTRLALKEYLHQIFIQNMRRTDARKIQVAAAAYGTTIPEAVARLGAGAHWENDQNIRKKHDVMALDDREIIWKTSSLTVLAWRHEISVLIDSIFRHGMRVLEHRWQQYAQEDRTIAKKRRTTALWYPTYASCAQHPVDYAQSTVIGLFKRGSAPRRIS